MGFPRLELAVQAELVPQLVMCLAGRPEPQQNRYGNFVSYVQLQLVSAFAKPFLNARLTLLSLLGECQLSEGQSQLSI